MSSEALKVLGDADLVRGGRAPSGVSSSPVRASSLKGKILMLYFSAHWCPPCRRFTPLLARLYGRLRSDASRDFECVFVSLDNAESEFDEYLGEMPWLAVPYAMSDERRGLARKYGARGIPHLVVLDSDGSVITADGTEEAQIDEDGERFPWRPPSFAELWPDSVMRDLPNGKTAAVPSAELRDKHLMLYFSAHWCPPCRRFTPVLSAAYEEMKKKGYADSFELVFVSSDRDRGQYDEYRREMPFPALAYEERRAKAGLAKRFGVTGIPRLLVLGPADEGGDRAVVNGNLKATIEAGELDDFPFPERSYGDVESGGEDLNERRCLVVFHEGGDDDEQGEVRGAVREAAEALEKEGGDMRFYWALSTGGIGDRVREIIKMKDVGDDAAAVLLDIPDGGGYYVMGEGKDATSGRALVEFVKSPGERKQM